ncbi:uncharacterized protein LOC134832043 isoform X2 [Culicoides brevitarsis]
MDYSPIRTYDDNHDAPWYREYLIMSPALIIVILVFGIFIRLVWYRRWLTKEIELLDSIEVPPPKEKMNKKTQTTITIHDDNPTTSKLEAELKELDAEVHSTFHDDHDGPMSTPAMVADFDL